MSKIKEEAIDLRSSLHKVREICKQNAKMINEIPSKWTRAQSAKEFTGLADYIGCLLIKDDKGREKALLRWAKKNK